MQTDSEKDGGKMKSRRSSKPKTGGPLEEEIRTAVKERYTHLALKGSSCCPQSPETMCGCSGIYPQAEIVSLPAEAIAVSAGCGNPGAIAELRPGMTVVDLGSGGGIDAFLASKKVGSKGKVIGVDATPEMIFRARKTAKENGYDEVEFRLGEIEHLPVESGSVDVIISNCVINLSPDKDQVFREAYRVLRPGGKLAVSDIVLMRDLPANLREDLSAWSECVSGAVSEAEYTESMRRAGFKRIKVEDRVVYTHDQLSGFLEQDLSMRGMSHKPSKLAGVELSDLVASYRISALKPKE